MEKRSILILLGVLVCVAILIGILCVSERSRKHHHHHVVHGPTQGPHLKVMKMSIAGSDPVLPEGAVRLKQYYPKKTGKCVECGKE